MNTFRSHKIDSPEPEVAIFRLNRRVDQLTQLLITYMQQAPLEREQRNFNAMGLAKVAARVVGGIPITNGAFSECCLVGHQYANGTFTWLSTGVLVDSRTVLMVTPGPESLPPNVVALGATDENHLGEAEIIGVQKVRGEKTSALTLLNEAATQPSQLASTEEIGMATRATLVGFGEKCGQFPSSFGLKRQTELEIVAVKRTPRDNLQQEEAFYNFDSDKEIVVGGTGFEPSSASSGGVLYITVGDALKVAALQSRGTGPAGCPDGNGSIFTRLDTELE